jgi:hypothetical protein
MNDKKPYIEIENIRTFSPDVFDYDLEWHVDFEDRSIKVLETAGWKIQFDNQIPQELEKDQEIFIEKMTWHRIIKGTGPLIVKITKLS